MTEAYIEGFCKMAEACGVDPNTLLQKEALAPVVLSKALLRALKLRGKTKALRAIGGPGVSVQRMGVYGDSVVDDALALANRMYKADAIQKTRRALSRALARSGKDLTFRNLTSTDGGRSYIWGYGDLSGLGGAKYMRRLREFADKAKLNVDKRFLSGSTDWFDLTRGEQVNSARHLMWRKPFGFRGTTGRGLAEESDKIRNADIFNGK